MESPLNLQTEQPTMSWEDWYVEFMGYVAKAMKIDAPSAQRYVNIDKAKEWYDDGFTPYVCFRENFNI